MSGRCGGRGQALADGPRRQNFDCANPETWAPVADYSSLRSTRASNPASIPEFQGGSYDAYNGSTYDACAQLTNGSFVRVFDKSLLGNGVKFVSQYMGYGGTNWGNLAFGGLVYTSYDYGAGVNEKRIVRDKLRELGLIGSFLQSFPAFANASLVEQGENVGVGEQSTGIFVSHLAAASSAWYVVRHSDSAATDTATFTLTVRTGGENVTIPARGTMTLVGRDAIIVPVDVPLAASGATLRYSTADVSFLGEIDGRDVVFAHGVAGQAYELAVQATSAITHTGMGDDGVSIEDAANGTTVAWTAQAGKASTVVLSTGGKDVLLVLSDGQYAQLLQPLSLAQPGTLDSIAVTGSSRIVAHGAYHIARSAMDAATLQLTGQLNSTTTVEVFAGVNVTDVTFNGVAPSSAVEKTAYGSLRATFDGPAAAATSYKPPALTGWKTANSLPEIERTYKPDDNWVSANLTTTPNTWQTQANETGGKVLFADAYGFHSGGNILWQGRFPLSSDEARPTQLNMTTVGGAFFASVVYLNGQYLGRTSSDASKQSSVLLDLPSDSLDTGTNIVTVLMDSTGLEEIGSIRPSPNTTSHPLPLENTKTPRGILQFALLGAASPPAIDWIVTGKQGGERVLDSVRGALNEGGLHGERMGWHLPGFDDSQWQTGEPSTGITTPGVQFYRTTVTLDVPAGHDLPLSIVFGGESRSEGETWRALVFVNGWQYARRLAQYGPQLNFPIPPGIIDPRGENTIAVALWATSQDGARIPSLGLEVQGVFAGDVEYKVNNPGYSEVRS